MFWPHRPPSDEKLGEYKREGGVNHSIILICLNLNLHHHYNTTFSLVLLPFSMFTAICRQQVGSEKRELSTCSTLSTTHTTLWYVPATYTYTCWGCMKCRILWLYSMHVQCCSWPSSLASSSPLRKSHSNTAELSSPAATRWWWREQQQLVAILWCCPNHCMFVTWHWCALYSLA